MVDMLRAAQLRRITEAEDEAREVRNLLDPARRNRYHHKMTADEGYRLAAAVANGLQAIREML